MASRHDPVLYGAKAFGCWLGHARIAAEPEMFLAGLNDSLRERMADLAYHLYSPPSENIREPIEQHLDTPADELLFEAAEETGLSPRPFWPDQAPYAVCLTHDIDRITYKYHAARSYFFKGRFGSGLKTLLSGERREYDPFFNLPLIKEYEDDWGVRSALYVLFEKRRFGRALMRGEFQHVIGVYDPESIKAELAELSGLGFEIGLHGSLDAFKDERALRSELGRLEGLLENPGLVVGVRNHYLRFRWPLTPLAQARNGLLYDSSIGYNFTCGFPCGTTFPFALGFEGDGPLFELPINVMDTALKFAAPSRETEVAEAIAREVRARGGLLMINWHQRFCRKDTDRVMYDWIEGVIRRAGQDGAFLARPSEVARYWRTRMG